MKAAEFLKTIKQNMKYGAYYLFGSEEYFYGVCQSALLEALSIPFPELNISYLSLKDTPDAIYTACVQSPLQAANRAVFLDARVPRPDYKVLERALDILPRQNKLIITGGEQPDKRTGFFKKLQSVGLLIEALPISKNEMAQWAVQLFKHQGIAIGKNTANLVVESTGEDMYLLKNEAAKMAYLEDKSEEGVLKALSHSLSYDVFQFHESMMKQDFETAFDIFFKVARNREELTRFVGLLVSKFFPMLVAKQGMGAGWNQTRTAVEIAERLKMRPYPAELAVRDSLRFSEEQLKNAVRKLGELDENIKTFVYTKAFLGVRRLFLEIYACL